VGPRATRRLLPQAYAPGGACTKGRRAAAVEVDGVLGAEGDQQAGEPRGAGEGTVTWYAFEVGDTTHRIFDTFADEEGRQAHLGGAIPAALGEVGPDLVASEPDIRPVDVIAVK
jgi:hypothetical protein